MPRSRGEAAGDFDARGRPAFGRQRGRRRTRGAGRRSARGDPFRHSSSAKTPRAARRGTIPARSSARSARSRSVCRGSCVITDVCLCEYTDHGHCGVIAGGDVDNDATVELLVREALSHARAGADIVAPVGHDGRQGRRDSQRARRRRIRPRRDHGVLGEVRVGVLRTVPRGRRVDAASSATGARTRWIRPTATRRCAKSRWISRRARTS